MAQQKLDKEVRKALTNARSMIQEIADAGCNEAVTRQRVERIFESCMGFNALKHITPEYAVHGVGDAEYCDLAIRLGEKEPPKVLVEIKRVTIKLSTKHLKQVASYAINKGCEWAMLTNGKEWRLYHISFDQPPQTTLVDSWDIIDNDLIVLDDKFSLIGYKNLKRGLLEQAWVKANVLTPHNVLKTILSENSISLIRRSLNRTKRGIAVSPEDVVGAVKRLLNENALSELENIKISLGGGRKKKAPSRKKAEEEASKKPGREEENACQVKED